jgi:hypothetical protein
MLPTFGDVHQRGHHGAWPAPSPRDGGQQHAHSLWAPSPKGTRRRWLGRCVRDVHPTTNVLLLLPLPLPLPPTRTHTHARSCLRGTLLCAVLLPLWLLVSDRMGVSSGQLWPPQGFDGGRKVGFREGLGFSCGSGRGS